MLRKPHHVKIEDNHYRCCIHLCVRLICIKNARTWPTKPCCRPVLGREYQRPGSSVPRRRADLSTLRDNCSKLSSRLKMRRLCSSCLTCPHRLIFHFVCWHLAPVPLLPNHPHETDSAVEELMHLVSRSQGLDITTASSAFCTANVRTDFLHV